MLISDPLDRYQVWQENTERIKNAYNWLSDDIMSCVESRKYGVPSDKDIHSFRTLFKLLDTALEFAEYHLKELGRELNEYLDAKEQKERAM